MSKRHIEAQIQRASRKFVLLLNSLTVSWSCGCRRCRMKSNGKLNTCSRLHGAGLATQLRLCDHHDLVVSSAAGWDFGCLRFGEDRSRRCRGFAVMNTLIVPSRARRHNAVAVPALQWQ
ncbi:hypothetical protein DFH08DRAFT_864925 [Mycena albidolilacea]|uniref:Uncharacterized protein n=1 Tax=Mycena albidolilacea TaxID=1033008 RepID=A0AAD7A4D1_9AGAR|nr:hypothetical protein DFH08DRAFT_864925 [Mycena albidolilacea]